MVFLKRRNLTHTAGEYSRIHSIHAALAVFASLGMAVASADVTIPDLTGFSIEDLMQVKVVSAAKMAQNLQDTAAAVFVITADDIRRSGVTHVMEALALAPGVQAARIDSSRWAVTIRGFNGRFANKLLVMIDGRTIYNPQFSGVYWEVQNLFLPDIERIEVIRGPGGSLWGANAVNGIIHIITKSATQTQGRSVVLAVGDEDRANIGLRYGGTLGDNAQYRVYGQFTEHDSLVGTDGRDAGDDWYTSRGGFRLDWTPSASDRFSAQGDVYEGKFDQNYVLPLLTPPYAVRQLSTSTGSGNNLQALWEHRFSATSQMSLQAYYQYEHHDDPVYNAQSHTFDLDFQHHLSFADQKELVWGLGYRRNADRFEDTAVTAFKPSEATTQLFSTFVQGQMDLIPEQLRLTMGVKVEHNDLTGWEWQPSLRMLWVPHPDHRLWAAVSRAVRTPSRGENSVQVDLFALPPSPLTGNLPMLLTGIRAENLQSERLIAYEIGHRARWSERFSVDTTAFYHDYDRVITAIPGQPFPQLQGTPHVVMPLDLGNLGAGYITGLELAADWHPLDNWRLRAAFSHQHSNIDQGVDSIYECGNRNQVSLFSSWNIGHDLELDAWWRYVDGVDQMITSSPSGTVKIDPYSNLSLRLGWRPVKGLELSLVGANLLDSNHLEFVQEVFTFPVEVERSFYGQLKWDF